MNNFLDKMKVDNNRYIITWMLHQIFMYSHYKAMVTTG